LYYLSCVWDDAHPFYLPPFIQIRKNQIERRAAAARAKKQHRPQGRDKKGYKKTQPGIIRLGQNEIIP
jgi:hypothetical protein